MNLAEFKQRIESGQAIVMFTAKWCGPCKRIYPEFERLHNECPNKEIDFFKIDVDESPEVASYANIHGMPTFHIYLRGNLIKSSTGADANRLRENYGYLCSCLSLEN